MPAYKQKCIRCKKNYVMVTGRRQVPVCIACGMREVDKPVDDPVFRKLFDIDRKFYEESSFLRSIKANYLRYGELSGRQVEFFRKVVAELKNPELLKQKTIYLLQPGDSGSTADQKSVVSSAELAAKGRKQAFTAASSLAEKGVQALYCGTAKAAVQAAAVIGEGLRLRPMKSAKLKDLKEESLQDVRARVQPFAEKLLASRYRIIAVVAHRDVNRALLAVLCEKPLDAFVGMAQPQDCVCLVDTAGKQARYICGHGKHAGLLT